MAEPRATVPPGDPPAPAPGPGWMKVVGGVLIGIAVAVAFIFNVPLKVDVAGQDVVDSQSTPTPVAKPAPAPGRVIRAKRSYGWKRPAAAPPASSRFPVNHLVRTSNPPLIDWRPADVPIWDQGQAGSCTGNGLAAVAAFYWKNGVGPGSALDIAPSRLGIYYDERAMEGSTCCDAGAAVGDGARVVATIGVAPESLWPYDLSKLARRPPQSYYAEAQKHRVPALVSVDNTDMDEVRTALANQRPIVFGFEVYASFEDIGPGGLYTPSGAAVGGHCVVAIGYDDGRQAVICRNSWGVDWGAQGYFFMPYSVFADARTTSDAWCIPSTPLPAPPPIPPAPPTPPTPSPAPDPAPTPGPPIPPPSPASSTTFLVSPAIGPGDTATLTVAKAGAPAVPNSILAGSGGVAFPLPSANYAGPAR